MPIQARLAHKYQVFMSNGRHSIVADEPTSVAGATDLGPAPYDLLLSSIAACKAMTVRMYSERKGWPLDGMTLELTHQKVKARDYAEAQSETGFVDVIECNMTFQGDLTEEQLARLRDISERCPVHRSLTSETIIHSNLA